MLSINFHQEVQKWDGNKVKTIIQKEVERGRRGKKEGRRERKGQIQEYEREKEKVTR